MKTFKRAVDRARRREAKKRKEGKGAVRLARAQAKGRYTKDALEDEVRIACDNWIQALRGIFQGYTMRRTIYSKDNNGKPISGLDPWHEEAIMVTLTEEEMEVQMLLAASLAKEGLPIDSKAVGVSNSICSPP